MNNKTIRAIKGTQDILPEESIKWQSLEDQIRKITSHYGYQEIRTPAFEKTKLFSRSVGEETDIVSKEMYSWTDQGGEDLTLKPELTASVARAFIQHNLGRINPINKLYYIDALFRRERPQKGRYRQFHQFGVEAFGSEHPEIDAEVIALAISIFKSLGLEGLKLNLNSIGSPECRINYRAALQKFLKPHFSELTETSQKRFNDNPLRILDTKAPHEIKILENAPNISNYLTNEDQTHFNEVIEYLDILEIQYKLMPRLVRGLDYYTRTTFEITSSNLGAQNAICGGGRYDGLTEMLGGKPTPGIGFAAGMERVLLLMKSKQFNKNKVQIYIVSLGEKTRATVIKLAQDLRNQSLNTEFDLLRRSLKAQLKEANKMNVKYAIIIGDKELESNQLEVKDFLTGNQQKVELNKIIEHMNSLSF
ncbi:histidine--tRNA ligase [Candidatus Marinimicrobia bacterium]|nr:histidine--tRNA ligase [Candidatus Neomarinimicrobiota bacterium]